MKWTLGDLRTGADAVGQSLLARGLTYEAARTKEAALRQAAGALVHGGLSGGTPAATFLVPGRIEVLGKHTDYAGGRTLVTAVDKGFAIVVVAREDTTVNIHAAAWKENASFDIAQEIQPPLGHWSNYPMTVARRIVQNFPGPLKGADIAFVSDLPPASGMSSSSAFMISIFMALAKVNQLDQRPEYRREITDNESLAGYLATIENGQNFGNLLGDKGVGTFGGSEDHTAILCCAPGQLSQYSYCPVRFERQIDLPKGYTFAVASSGVVAEKTGAAREKYNLASLLARRCGEIWRKQTGGTEPHLAAILASDPNAGDRLRDLLTNGNDPDYASADLVKRFEHFRSESEELIPQAGDGLAAGDIATFGRCVDVSQALAETLLGTQVPATISLAHTARELGAHAASAFGAGYGGSVWALVEESKAEPFLRDWTKAHEKAFPDLTPNAAFFLTHPGPAAGELTPSA